MTKNEAYLTDEQAEAIREIILSGRASGYVNIIGKTQQEIHASLLEYTLSKQQGKVKDED